METLFHIGTAKTGSSALQQAFHQSSDYLAACGVLYPRNPARPGSENHRLFALELAPLAGLPRHMKPIGTQADAEAALAGFHAAIATMIAETKPRLLLLSAETMLSVVSPVDYRGRLRASLDALGAAPSFVAYLRRPSSAYLSGMQQTLLLRAKLQQPRAPRYRPNIRFYEREFGRRRITLQLFERSALSGGDIVNDFCQRHLARFGVEAAQVPRRALVNESMSAESMTIMRAFRQDFLAGHEDRKVDASSRLRRLLLAADAAVGASKPRLRPEIAEAIDGCCTDALWVRDEYGVVLPDFDYRRLERGELLPLPDRELSLPEITFVDPSVRRAIIEFVREKPWTNPRRRRWLAAQAAEM